MIKREQSDYDYSGRVTAALQLVRVIDALLASPAILPQAVTLSRHSTFCRCNLDGENRC